MKIGYQLKRILWRERGHETRASGNGVTGSEARNILLMMVRIARVSIREVEGGGGEQGHDERTHGN